MACSLNALAVQAVTTVCPRPLPGSLVEEPADLRSVNGVLETTLSVQNSVRPDGSVRYCYTDDAGHQSPNLRVHPGDLIVLHLNNELTEPNLGVAATTPIHPHIHPMNGHACSSGAMTAISTNLHFHGLTIPPVCHQDEVLTTSVQPGDPPFEYRFTIPQDEPPGLYWYHPHIHGFAKQQLLGGASGALIVEGIERSEPSLGGLPERVFIIRDQDLMDPAAQPAKSEPVIPKFLVDRDGDAANTGTGFGKPAKDLSINFVPVPYPDYPPAIIKLRAGERQLWRVLNASAITYLNLQMLILNAPQPLGLVAIDGVPMHHIDTQSAGADWQTHLGVPPGSRVEFIVTAPSEGQSGLLVTRSVDTGPGGENDPNRMLATIEVPRDAPQPHSSLQPALRPTPSAEKAWLGDVQPVRTRRLYFSEKLDDPNDPTSAVEFYLTVDGQEPKMFEMTSDVPNIVTEQGTVEDWIIENRSRELHDFHIHQLHFLLLEYQGRSLQENFLRDTVNVPYYDGHSLAYPSVRLRMDFRDPKTIGTFLYHCHILEHEDKGMMGTIRVVSPSAKTDQNVARSCENNTAESRCSNLTARQ